MFVFHGPFGSVVTTNVHLHDMWQSCACCISLARSTANSVWSIKIYSCNTCSSWSPVLTSKGVYVRPSVKQTGSTRRWTIWSTACDVGKIEMENFGFNQYTIVISSAKLETPHLPRMLPLTGVMSSSDTHFTREYVPLCTDLRLGRWLFHRWKTSESPMVAGGRTASIQRCPGLELDGDIQLVLYILLQPMVW